MALNIDNTYKTSSIYSGNNLILYISRYRYIIFIGTFFVNIETKYHIIRDQKFLYDVVLFSLQSISSLYIKCNTTFRILQFWKTICLQRM